MAAGMFGCICVVKACGDERNNKLKAFKVNSFSLSPC